jgi:hypothetical protein
MDEVALFYSVAFSVVGALAAAGMALDWLIWGRGKLE